VAKGRPREFDPNEALDKALEVFWRHGFEGASMPALTEAMGINRPSLYAAFGNKEALFRKALDRYAEGPASHVRCSLNEPTARAVAEKLMYGAVDLATNPKHPGCFAVQGALACGESAESVRKETADRRAATEKALRMRFERAVAEHDLPASVDPADLARYVSAVTHGIAILAVSGAGREELRRVVDTALKAWPV
jgi:AcrR family transcriptional regulator